MGRAALALGLCLLLIGLLFSSLTPSAVAAGSITVVTNTYQNNFPTRITFNLEARSDTEINQVILFYGLGDDPVITRVYPEFTPGRQVKVEHVWNTQRQYIPPELTVRYYWVIENSGGDRLKTAPLVFVNRDTRFPWQRLHEGQIELLWYKGEQGFAQQLLDAATAAAARLEQEVGVKIEKPIKILIYKDQTDLLGVLEPKAHEWTGGRAFPEQGIIVIAASPSAEGLDYGRRTVAHELSHIVIYQATANPYGDIPNWLDEGLAMYNEGGVEPSYSRTLRKGVEENKLISVKSLSGGFPDAPEQALLAYAESYSLVRFILERYGSEKMARLLHIFREGATYDEALQRALGVDSVGLDAQWRESLGLPATPPTPVPPAAAPSSPLSSLPLMPIILLVLLLGFVLTLVRVMRRSASSRH
ncbi:MAG: peptidase MA family metallohydrolase [Chloroflexi bacterium]|nr:peptidase MA family metallohydrolase [Chloroflexota bacterium]MCL5075918.1 peptidase MA family metallohydrolase [Chloroflexota bacterium]